jgi:hypothetical protein
MVNSMAVVTLKFEKSDKDGLFYLTEGTTVEGFEVIDGKLYNEKGEHMGEIINMNQDNNHMTVEIKLNRWLLQSDE